MTQREAIEKCDHVLYALEEDWFFNPTKEYVKSYTNALCMAIAALEAQEPRFWKVNGNRITCPNPKCRNNAILLNGKLTPEKWMGRRPYCSHCGWRLNKPTTEQMAAEKWCDA